MRARSSTGHRWRRGTVRDVRARIYDEGFEALFRVELEDGRAFSWQTPEDVQRLIRELRLVPWPDAPPTHEGRVDTSGAWLLDE